MSKKFTMQGSTLQILRLKFTAMREEGGCVGHRRAGQAWYALHTGISLSLINSKGCYSLDNNCSIKEVITCSTQHNWEHQQHQITITNNKTYYILSGCSVFSQHLGKLIIQIIQYNTFIAVNQIPYMKWALFNLHFHK